MESIFITESLLDYDIFSHKMSNGSWRFINEGVQKKILTFEWLLLVQSKQR